MKTIAVHSSSFHADDCLAIYLLLHTDEFRDAKIIRTRDPTVYNQCDAVVDVGEIYDHLLRRYDHHQVSCTDTFPNSKIPMASSGLVYLHHGEEVIKNLCNELKLVFDEENFDFIYNYLYFHYVQEIDAQDNGINPCNEKPYYNVSSSICSRISRLNPHWKIENPNFDEYFKKGVELIGKDFEFFLTYAVKSEVNNFIAAKKAFETRFDFDPSGQFLNVPKYFPITEFLDLLEGNDKKILYLLYKRKDDTNGKTWAVRSINTDKQFESRKPLPFPGVNAEEMKEKTGIDGLVFAHKNPFLAVFKEKDQALQYARFAADYKLPEETNPE